MCWFSYMINCTIIFPAFTSSAHSSLYSAKPRTLVSARYISHNREHIHMSKWFWADKMSLYPAQIISIHLQGWPSVSNSFPMHYLFSTGSFQPAQYRTDWNRTLITGQWFWWGGDTALAASYDCPFISGHMGSHCSLMWNKEAFYKKNIGDIVRSQATRHW